MRILRLSSGQQHKIHRIAQASTSPETSPATVTPHVAAPASTDSGLPQKPDVALKVAQLALKQHNNDVLLALRELFTENALAKIATFSERLRSNYHIVLNDKKNRITSALRQMMAQVIMATHGIRTRHNQTLLGYVDLELAKLKEVLDTLGRDENTRTIIETTLRSLEDKGFDDLSVAGTLATIQNSIFPNLNKPTQNKGQSGNTSKVKVESIIATFMQAATNHNSQATNNVVQSDLNTFARRYADYVSQEIPIPDDNKISATAQAITDIFVRIMTGGDKLEEHVTELCKALGNAWPAWHAAMRGGMTSPAAINGPLRTFIQIVYGSSYGGRSAEEYTIIFQKLLDESKGAIIKDLQAVITKESPNENMSSLCETYSNIAGELNANPKALAKPSVVQSWFPQYKSIGSMGGMGNAKIVLDACTSMVDDENFNDQMVAPMINCIMHNIRQWGEEMIHSSRSGTATDFILTRKEDVLNRPTANQPADNQQKVETPVLAHPESIMFCSQILWHLYGRTRGFR